MYLKKLLIHNQKWEINWKKKYPPAVSVQVPGLSMPYLIKFPPNELLYAVLLLIIINIRDSDDDAPHLYEYIWWVVLTPF